MKKILIYGAGGNSKSLINLIESTKQYKIIGLIGLKSEIKKKILKYEVKFTDKDLKKLSKKIKYVAISNTYYSDLKKKTKIIMKLKKNFLLPKIISPNSTISKYCKVGKGVQVYNNVIINTDNLIGDFSVLNTGCIIEHDVVLKSNTHISTGVVINGGCIIGENTFIGSGSVLRQNVHIKKNSFIKMMSKII